MIRAFTCVLMCFVGVGCASLNLQKPTARVSAMSVHDVNADGFTMNFNVDLTNPNSIALPLSAADYNLGLAGIHVLNGKASPKGSIPAGGTTSVMLPVTLTFETLLQAEQAIVKTGGNVPYVLDGGLSLSTGSPLTGNLRVPLQYRGTLLLKEVVNDPQALLQNPAAQKLARQLLSSMLKR